MRWIAILTVMLIECACASPSWAQGAVGLDRVAVRTLASALAFLEPRTLEPVGFQQLSLWGLRGLTTLDPQLTVDWRDRTVRLLSVDRVVYVHGAPADDTAAAWANAVGAIVQEALSWSDTVRQAGSTTIVRSFFDEVFNHLDPYSRYVPPAGADQDRARRDGDASPGLLLARRGAGWVVSSVQPDGPAADMGIAPGDRVLELDGQALAGLSLADINALLLGPDGSSLTLTVSARGGQTGDIEVVRVSVPPPTVFAAWVSGLYVVRVTAFNRDTAPALARELKRTFATAARRPAALVLDLRGNRGGLLKQAADAADLLMSGGLIAMTAGRNPGAIHEFVADGSDLLAGRPVIVLVDGRSASSAEILAAALADSGRGVAVGSSTLGKGLVQTIGQLPDGGELFVTWSRVLAPGGWPLQGLGVLPQVCTSKGNDVLQDQLRRLDSGQQPMAQALAAHRAARAPIPSAVVLEMRQECPASEGRDNDLQAARFLVAHPRAYAAALLR